MKQKVCEHWANNLVIHYTIWPAKVYLGVRTNFDQLLGIIKRRPLYILHDGDTGLLGPFALERMQTHNRWRVAGNALHIAAKPNAPLDARAIDIVIQQQIRGSIQNNAACKRGCFMIEHQNGRLVKVLLSQTKAVVLFDAAQNHSALFYYFSRVIGPLRRIQRCHCIRFLL
jgi:hypothetical protein